ncbi:klaroid protein-like [Periplaneta americana]|uniref:klaroid protein-like n=1 Tax=Periplaneta americana TaxID=6978 RepID=UPI0037E81B86
MEEEDIGRDLRRSSRSRSHTPFIRASRDRDSTSTYGVEESKHVTSHTQTKGRQRGGSRQKSNTTSVVESRTSEVSVTTHKHVRRKTGNESDSSIENAVEDQQKIGRRSDRQKAKRRLLINGAMPRKGDERLAMTADSVEEETVQKRHHHKTSDYSSEEGEGLAYQVYKQAGDWWNKFPKTDYTYSPVSPHRKELAPGVIPMPNMSRRSLNTVRLDSSSETMPSSSTFTTVTKRHVTKSRWLDPSTSGSQATRKVLEDWAAVDSDVDEVAESISSKTSSHTSKTWNFTTVTKSFFLAIWTFITVSYTRTVNAMYRLVGHDTDVYATPRRGVSPMKGEGSPNWLWRLFNWFYQLVCTVMQLDLLLLSSWHTSQVTQEHELYYEDDDYVETDAMSKSFSSRKRNTWRLLLLLLPLLFLAGWWSVSEASETSLTPLVDSMTIFKNSVIGWLFIPFEALGALKERLFSKTIELPVTVIPPGDQNSQQQQQTVDMATLTEYILTSAHFQQLLATQVNAETQTKQKEKGQLESALHQQEQLQNLNKKLLEEQQDLLSQLTGHINQMQQKVDHLSSETEDIRNREQNWELKWEEERQASNERTATHLPVMDTGALMRKEMRDLQIRLKLLQEQHTQMLRRCCQPKSDSVVVDGNVIEQHVLKVLAELLGATRGQFSGNMEDLRVWINNMLVARDDLESRLANLTFTLHLQTREAIQRSKEVIMASVSERIQDEFAKWQEQQRQEEAKMSSSSNMGTWAANGSGIVGLTNLQVRAIVDEALAKYDADKTGLVDYALESSGGSIESTRCTENYQAKTATLSLLGIPFWYPSNTPRTVIQPGVHPGECWAFTGSQGFLVIRLSGLVHITAFSLEHIPRALSPYGRIDSAPKDFSVWGLKQVQDAEPILLGKYMYRQNGTSLQNFSVQRTDTTDPYDLVELRIESNHGNMEYTCLYRFRVHGVLMSK